jgi:hypothetical protein
MADLYAYDTVNNRLSRLQVISSTVDPVTGEVYGVLLAQVDGAASNLALESGGNLSAIKGDTDELVTNTTGLATQATLAASKTDLDTIATNLGHFAISDSLDATVIPVIIPGLSNGAGGAERLRSVDGVNEGTTFGLLANGPFLYNGSGWDKQRANVDNVTILASAARTTTTTSADFTNNNARGVLIAIDTTVLPGSAVSNVVTVNGKDPVSGKYNPTSIITSTTIVGISTVFLYIYPGITTSANVAVSMVLPRTFQVKVTAGNSNSCTYSIGASFIL